MVNPEMFGDDGIKEIISRKNNNNIVERKPNDTRKRSNDIIKTKESDNAELELQYQTALLDLREKFPTIPEDLTNKSINIRYKWENWVYRNIYLYNDWIALPWEKSLAINKIWESWNSSAYSREKWLIWAENFSFSEFNQRIDDIIKNADKCEIEIKDLDRPRIPTKE